jgi:hypothetical protein
MGVLMRMPVQCCVAAASLAGATIELGKLRHYSSLLRQRATFPWDMIIPARY